MNLIHEVVNYFTNLPPSTWTTLGAYLGGSTLVASLLQIAKHKFNFAEAQKFVTLALGFISFLVAFANFLLQTSAGNPLPQLGHTTGLLMAGAVVVHRFAVSPGYYKLVEKLKKFSDVLAELEAQQAVTKAALAPVPTDQPSEESNVAQFQV